MQKIIVVIIVGILVYILGYWIVEIIALAPTA
ncbi:hypothetical protein SAMN05192560_2298 [Methylobacillus rhizosphaerae]|uniref:Uncharacterized protein n=1 Tax=Methylobacillus rhizosphaerae TaxID=551994 RepID=A0A239B520_9PROT|nr:hypothetical protein SAMN05192560_2298 [Methylobacillus rhizosphaerae]